MRAARHLGVGNNGRYQLWSVTCCQRRHTIGVIGKTDLHHEIGAGKNQPMMV